MEFIRIFLNDLSNENNKNKNIIPYRELTYLNNNKFQCVKNMKNFIKVEKIHLL